MANVAALLQHECKRFRHLKGKFMKLKSDPKTGLLSYIIAFSFLLVIAIDISKSMNESKTPPAQTVTPPVVQVIQPQYTQIPIPVSKQEGTKSYYLMQLSNDGSTTKFLYKVTYTDLITDPTSAKIPETHHYFVKAETMCQLNTFRHIGQSETIEGITTGEGSWWEPKQGDNVFDIIKFVCANTK